MPAKTTETARVPEDLSGRQRRMPVGGITWRHTFRALRHPNYRLFFWGQLVSLTGTWMQQTAMSWFVYQITNSKFLLGFVSAVGSAPMVLSSIWGGALADLYPKRSILVGTQSAQMVCAVLLATGNCDGLRHARAPVVHGGNDKPRRFAECDLAQQLHCKWSARRRSVYRWLNDWRRRRGDVLFPERPQLCRCNRRFADDASSALRAKNRNRFSGRARLGGYRVFDKTSACAHGFAAISSGRRFRLVVCGPDTRVCTRCARTRRKLLRDSDVGERNRRIRRCPARRDVWTSFHSAQSRTRRRLVIFRGDAGAFV